MSHVCVVGSGAWGTALALTALRSGNTVSMLARTNSVVQAITEAKENKKYLPGFPIPEELTITADDAILETADCILMVAPAQTVRENCHRIKDFVKPGTPIVICAKGIEQGPENLLLSQVVGQVLDNPIAILSGPTFADEVAGNLPAAVCIASKDKNVAMTVADTLRHSRFRCYVSEDIVGVQVAGGVKNVIAIACGIVRGKKFGNNAAAAVITRGLAEMRRLALGLGGQSDTFLGLAGVGDLTLTCSSDQSRNMSLGRALGEGKSLNEILRSRHSVSEGVFTTAAVNKLAEKLSIKMPLCDAINQVLYKNKDTLEVIESVLSHQQSLEDV